MQIAKISQNIPMLASSRPWECFYPRTYWKKNAQLNQDSHIMLNYLKGKKGKIGEYVENWLFVGIDDFHVEENVGKKRIDVSEKSLNFIGEHLSTCIVNSIRKFRHGRWQSITAFQTRKNQSN